MGGTNTDFHASTSSAFGSDVFGDSLGDIDLWGEDASKGFGEMKKFKEAGDTKDFGDDFTVDTVSTGQSYSGHSRSTLESHSTSSSLSSNSKKSCVIDDLNRSRHRTVRRNKSERSNESKKVSSSSSSSDGNSVDKPRSLRRGLGGETRRQASRRNLLATVQKPNSVSDLRRMGHSSSSSSLAPKATGAENVPQKNQEWSTTSSSTDKPKSSRRMLFGEQGKSASLRRIPTRGMSTSRKKSLRNLFQDTGPQQQDEQPQEQDEQPQEQDEQSAVPPPPPPPPPADDADDDNIFEVMQPDPTAQHHRMDRRTGLVKSRSTVLSRSNRKLGSLDDPTSSKTLTTGTTNFQRGARPGLGRSTSFRMSIKKQASPSQTAEESATAAEGETSSSSSDRAEDGTTNPDDSVEDPSKRHTLGRCVSMGGNRKPRQPVPGDGSSAARPLGRPPTTPTSKARRKRIPTRSKSLSTGEEITVSRGGSTETTA